MNPYRACRHCQRTISSFGGVWFEKDADASCDASPDTQHRPRGVAVPEPRPAPDVKAAKTRAVHEALARVVDAKPVTLPASVIARGADTASTHGASGRKRWN